MPLITEAELSILRRIHETCPTGDTAHRVALGHLLSRFDEESEECTIEFVDESPIHDEPSLLRFITERQLDVMYFDPVYPGTHSGWIVRDQDGEVLVFGHDDAASAILAAMEVR